MSAIKNKFIRDVQSLKRKFKKTQVITDEDYNSVLKKVEQTEITNNNFTKRVGQLVENFHALATTLKFLSDDVKDLYMVEDREQRELALRIGAIADEIEKSCVLPFQDQVKTSILDVSKQREAKFTGVKSAHQKRKNKLLEFEYHRDRVQKLSEKQSKNPMELPKAKEQMEKSKSEYEEADAHAKVCIQDILDERMEIYDPMVSLLLLQFVDYTEEVAKVAVKLRDPAKSLQVNGGKRLIQEGDEDFEDLVNQSSGTPSSDPYAYKPPTRSATIVGNQHAPNNGSNMPKRSASVMVSSFAVPPEYNCEWYYLDANVQQQGPVTFNVMRQKFKNGELNANSHVFGADMADWKTIQSVPKLLQIMQQ